MDLLKQCQQWFEQDEAQKVIDTLEAIPAEERTPELDSELAKAYIAVAHIGEREPFEKALELLAPHEEHFAEDHCWNYRIASAYYFLDEEGPALRYFEKALKARPGDKDTQEYIDDCRRRLSLPRFEKNFRERTQEAWAAFSQIEVELRQIIETDETHQRGEELVEKCGNALKTALRDTSFELGFNGEKYELILSPEGLRSRLFPLVYFQKQAPESVLEHWNIWVGRQPCEGFAIPSCDNKEKGEILNICKETGCELKIVPSIYQMMNSGEKGISKKIRKVQIEDLLGREPISLEINRIIDYVANRPLHRRIYIFGINYINLAYRAVVIKLDYSFTQITCRVKRGALRSAVPAFIGLYSAG